MKEASNVLCFLQLPFLQQEVSGIFWYFTATKDLDSLKKHCHVEYKTSAEKFPLKMINLLCPFETAMRETTIIRVKARACSLTGNKQKGRQLPSSMQYLFLPEPHAVQQYFLSIENSSNCKNITKITILQTLIKIATQLSRRDSIQVLIFFLFI